MFSIIICTYNPNPYIFQRLLKAINEFDKDSPTYEVIIVDNNSTVPLTRNKAVEIFLLSKSNAKLITEKNPGLTSARLAGIEYASYDWLIFFDDDNEPATDYLSEIYVLTQMYSDIGAWGPGKINVQFCNGIVPSWINDYKYLFQEKQALKIEFDSEKIYQDCYPNGTGLILRKEIALKYLQEYNSGSLTLKDRSGKSLSSGGDTQMVLLAIKNNFKAGTSPSLKLNHLIDNRKANSSYLRKQIYYTSSSYFRAYNEVFQENRLPAEYGTNIQIIKSLYAAFKINYKSKDLHFIDLRWAKVLGEYASPYIAYNKTMPFILKTLEKFFING